MAKIRTTTGLLIEMKVDELRGKRVRLRHKVSNSYLSIAEGTEVTVTSTWRSGVNIVGEHCATCGVAARILHVDRSSIELVVPAVEETVQDAWKDITPRRRRLRRTPSAIDHG